MSCLNEEEPSFKISYHMLVLPIAFFVWAAAFFLKAPVEAASRTAKHAFFDWQGPLTKQISQKRPEKSECIFSCLFLDLVSPLAIRPSLSPVDWEGKELTRNQQNRCPSSRLSCPALQFSLLKKILATAFLPVIWCGRLQLNWAWAENERRVGTAGLLKCFLWAH